MSEGAHVSERWAAWRAAIDLEEYHSRWARLEAAGEAAHGEADLVASYQPSTVLDAGCGMGRVAIELDRRGVAVEGVDLDADLLAYARIDAPHLVWHHADLAGLSLGRRYDVVVLAGNVPVFCAPRARAALVAGTAAHVAPGGVHIAGFSLDGVTLAEYDAACAAAGLVLADRFATWDRAPYAGGPYAVSVHRPT